MATTVSPQPAGARLRIRSLVPQLTWENVLAAAVVGVGLGVRVVLWWQDRPLWLDEEKLALNLRDRGFLGLAGRLGEGQAAPYGWLVGQRAVTDLLGHGERALRLLPLLFGLGAVVLAGLAARRYLGRTGGAIAVGLVGLSPALVRYSAELKQYSSDAFWVLALLYLAARALDRVSDAPARPARRAVLLWWVVAAGASWFSMAAIEVAAPVAVLLVAVVLRRRGPLASVWAALPGLLLLASVAAHYAVSLRFVLGDPYFTAYWQASGYPPVGGNPLSWLVAQFGVLVGFPLVAPGAWVVAVAVLVVVGWVVALVRRPAYGLLLLAPWVIAVALAVARLSPLVDRLALWLAPPTYLAMTVALVAAFGFVRARLRRPVRPLVAATAGVLALAAVATVLVGVVAPMAGQVGRVLTTRDPIDDRAALAYIRGIHRADDVTLFVAAADQARKWYVGGALRPTWRVENIPRGPGCDSHALVDTVRGHPRVVVYAGSRVSPWRETAALLMTQLAPLGQIRKVSFGGAGSGDDGERSVVYVVDLHGPSSDPGQFHPRTHETCVQLL